jgi:hypothetical protein
LQDKKEKKAKKEKREQSSQPSTPKKSKKKDDEPEEEVYRWWEEEELPDGQKWRTLEHYGPLFPPEYIRLPRTVHLLCVSPHCSSFFSALTCRLSLVVGWWRWCELELSSCPSDDLKHSLPAALFEETM